MIGSKSCARRTWRSSPSWRPSSDARRSASARQPPLRRRSGHSTSHSLRTSAATPATTAPLLHVTPRDTIVCIQYLISNCMCKDVRLICTNQMSITHSIVTSLSSELQLERRSIDVVHVMTSAARKMHYQRSSNNSDNNNNILQNLMTECAAGDADLTLGSTSLLQSSSETRASSCSSCSRRLPPTAALLPPTAAAAADGDNEAEQQLMLVSITFFPPSPSFSRLPSPSPPFQRDVTHSTRDRHTGRGTCQDSNE